MRTLKTLLVVCALALATAACDSEGPQGPPGEDGNANVTLYVFDGHDFSTLGGVNFCLGEGLTEQEVIQSSWNAYLGMDPGSGITAYFHVPGNAGPGTYLVGHGFDDGNVCGSAQPIVGIVLEGGTGVAFDEIRVLRTEPTNVEDCRGGGCLRASSEPVVPEDLDITDYDAVVEYYGITEDDIVRL